MKPHTVNWYLVRQFCEFGLQTSRIYALLIFSFFPGGYEQLILKRTTYFKIRKVLYFFTVFYCFLKKPTTYQRKTKAAYFKTVPSDL
jgi:hypothetical protein